MWEFPLLWDILEGGDASCSWCPPFYLLPIPSSLSGPEIRRLTNTCDCWKHCMPENVPVFHTFDKKNPLPKPEILQPAQFWHQYLNIQGRMSHFSEVVNSPKFRLNEEPNILYLGTSRKLKSGSSLSCLEGKKTNIRVLLNTRNHQVWQTTVEPNC